MICILILLGSCGIAATICVVAAAMLSSRISRNEKGEEITTMENARLFIGDESLEVTSYQIGVDPAHGEDESVFGVWRWIDNRSFSVDLTLTEKDFDLFGLELLYEELFGYPFYRWPKWVMQVVLFLAFIILVMVLS